MAIDDVVKGRLQELARKTLSIDLLTEWLAGKVNMEYAHVDPFKVDFAAVTKVMSSAYAARYKILPISVSAGTATIATCEPFSTLAWTTVVN